MPAAITRGALSAAGFGFASGAGTVARFIGASLTTLPNANPTTGAVSFPNARAGDLAIIWVWQGFADDASITGGAGGWTKTTLKWTDGLGYFSAAFAKTLASGDLAGVTLHVSTGNSVAVAVIYRGPTVATLKSSVPGVSGTTLTLPGFTKSLSIKGVITFVQDRDEAASPTQPTGFSMRETGNGGFIAAAAADLLRPRAYANGSSVTWTNFLAVSDQAGVMFELT